jgi:hypothetical protein
VISATAIDVATVKMAAKRRQRTPPYVGVGLVDASDDIGGSFDHALGEINELHDVRKVTAK